MRIYNQEIIQHINLFENITKARVKDCIIDKHLIFIVEKGEIGKAIGKNAVNVKKLENLLKKKVRIIEFDVLEKLIKNLIYPIDAEVEVEEGNVKIRINGLKEKGIVIGRDGSNLNIIKGVIKNFYKDIKDIRVV